MRVILSAILAAVVLGIGAAYLLATLQRPAYEAFSTVETRVGNPGSNLVGSNWSGLNQGEGSHAREP